MERVKQLRRLGRRCFKLMWIPFIGIFIGMIGMPEGEYAWAELPLITRVSVVLTTALFIGTFGYYAAARAAAARAGGRIRKHGHAAEATIVKVWETGTMINRNPVVGLRLKIDAASGHPAFEAETTQLVSLVELSQYEPGARVPVRYLPDSQEVALVT